MLILYTAELKDEELFPRLEKANPHKATYASMQLFLRYQIEEYAFSDKKWGSGEALDAEFERRESEKKKRKDAKFRAKLADLKKRTRFEAHRRIRDNKDTGAGIGDKARFDERIERGKHVHEWGRSLLDPETGMSKKRCTECGMEVEELDL
jgi:DNA-repair protein complementing XP-A cells